MKVIFAITTSLALFICSNLNAQNEPGQDASAQPEVSQPIEEPSGSDPTAAPPVPGQEQFTPVTPDATTTGQTNGTNATITISQSFTNDPNAITIVGTVDSEQQKQDVAMKLQEALPGKQINNHLTVSAQQGIVEPAGSENKPEDEQLEDEERDFELNEESEDTAPNGPQNQNSGSEP